jgi:Zn-dependent metalloprotease
MESNNYRVMVFKNGKQHVEEYQAIIGIKVEGNNIMLHIRENGVLDEMFWRNLPSYMQQQIEHGLKIRKSQQE